ncbi:MAG: dihydrodipicolinate synthase family protein [Dysosmobacter welbionis]
MTLREDGSINYGEYTRLTQFITDAGVHGVFVCGTTGEFVNLTLEERKRLLTAAVREQGRRAVFCSTPRP